MRPLAAYHSTLVRARLEEILIPLSSHKLEALSRPASVILTNIARKQFNL